MAIKHISNFKFTFLVPVACLSLITTACNHTRVNSQDLKNDAAKLANLECESREITHQKFILAQKYQALETRSDKRLVSDKPTFNKTELDKQKTVLINLSLQKSDTINHILKSLWQTKYTSNEDKKKLDAATETELKKICSLTTP